MSTTKETPRRKSRLETKREYRLIAVAYVPLGVALIIGGLVTSFWTFQVGFTSLTIGVLLVLLGIGFYVNSNKSKPEVEKIALVSDKEVDEMIEEFPEEEATIQKYEESGLDGDYAPVVPPKPGDSESIKIDAGPETNRTV